MAWFVWYKVMGKNMPQIWHECPFDGGGSPKNLSNVVSYHEISDDSARAKDAIAHLRLMYPEPKEHTDEA